MRKRYTCRRLERLFLTLVHANVEGDRFFPEWRTAFPRIIQQRDSADQNYRYTFYELGRRYSRRIGARPQRAAQLAPFRDSLCLRASTPDGRAECRDARDLKLIHAA